MRGDLLWADSLEQSLHVAVVVEANWVLSSVIWVLVTRLHAAEFVSVVALSVLSLILSLASVL